MLVITSKNNVYILGNGMIFSRVLYKTKTYSDMQVVMLALMILYNSFGLYSVGVTNKKYGGIVCMYTNDLIKYHEHK